ncbi:hypothetical protein ACFTWH_08330 [Streptomyces sp. NPDC057011]|uniref:hypothetical protein n=1 Tax=unclassified Streptomyces TaxID=2593676 RepID=UPI003631BA50
MTNNVPPRIPDPRAGQAERRAHIAAVIAELTAEHPDATHVYDAVMDLLAAVDRIPGAVLEIRLPGVLDAHDMTALGDTLTEGRTWRTGRLTEATGVTEHGAHVRVMTEVAA